MAGYEDFVDLVHQCALTIFFFHALRNPHFARKTRARLAVQKMYNLFIGGKFVQGENAAFCQPLSKKAIEIQSV
jgi:hypothetical protein